MKTAIVTGASSGIGFEISKVLLSLGFKVYGIGRDFEKISLDDENFCKLSIDLMDIKKLETTVEKIKKEENVYILVNNAGVGYFGPHEEINSNKIHEMVRINLEVPMILSQMLLREFKKNKGIIINISSVTAKKSSTYGCCYGATKGALSHFGISLFDEARKYGVKVINIHPDMTKTNFYRNANFKEGQDEDSYIDSKEVAEAVKFVLDQREGMVITDITIKPQRHQLSKK